METQVYHLLARIERELWWYHGRRRTCQLLLRRHLGPSSERRVLDVGCGTAYSFGMLREFGQVQGVEPSAEALAWCRQNGVEGVQQAQADALPFENETFDLVTALDVLEHLEDDGRAVREAYRVTRPGGWLLVHVPALPVLYGKHDQVAHHYRRYLKSTLLAPLRAAGYQPVHCSYGTLAVLPLVVLVRLVVALMPGRPHVEMKMPPAPVNAFLTVVARAESSLVAGPGLPLGMTLVALARKP